MGFTYENKSYGNNSVILIHYHSDDVYRPLISCITDNSSFYSQGTGFSESDWYDPSGRRISDSYEINYNQLDELCFIKPPYDSWFTGIPLLYTLGASFTESTNNCSGLFRCLIPDHHGELQQLFLGIYSEICKYIMSYVVINSYS